MYKDKICVCKKIKKKDIRIVLATLMIIGKKKRQRRSNEMSLLKYFIKISVIASIMFIFLCVFVSVNVKQLLSKKYIVLVLLINQ